MAEKLSVDYADYFLKNNIAKEVKIMNIEIFKFFRTLLSLSGRSDDFHSRKHSNKSL